MAFDVEEHLERQKIINYGREKWPEEKNITNLYQMACKELGVVPKRMTSGQASKLPAPHETVNKETGKFWVPRKDCPQCGKKDGLTLRPLCASCTDADGGKYKTMWFCGEMDPVRNLIAGTGCGFKDKSGKFYSQWLNEMGIDYESGMKADMGIKTVTDKGLK